MKIKFEPRKIQKNTEEFLTASQSAWFITKTLRTQRKIMTIHRDLSLLRGVKKLSAYSVYSVVNSSQWQIIEEFCYG